MPGSRPMDRLDQQARHYATVARAIAFIRVQARAQPTLEEIAAAVHLSPQHLQRVFCAWAGISPKRFLQYLTKEYARTRLAAATATITVAAAAGLSGTGRLHDLMVSCEAMTPGEIQAAARGIDIGHGIAPTPFGDALVAWTVRGVCHFAFRSDRDDGDETMIAELRARWPAAVLHRDDDGAQALMQRIFAHAPAPGRVHLVLRGTNFQVKVWEALIRIPPGDLRSYRQLATTLGQRDAARALGGALAANTIGYLIPCHRVIRAGGEVGDYRWGSERKLALLGCEAARHGS